MAKTFPHLLFIILMCSCRYHSTSNREISIKERNYLSGLGLLNNDEKIILFDSQGGGFSPIKQSGNFFTDKRIASYWIDKDKSKSHSEFAFYHEIDTIWRFPKYHSLTLASYLEVHRKDGTTFKVYISEDSAGTWTFFNKALHQWCETTNRK